MKKIIDEESLDHPQDSVEFLEYMKKHQEKTDGHKRRLHKLSKILLFVGVAALGVMAFKHLTHSGRSRHHQGSQDDGYSGKHHKLGASADVQGDGLAQTFSYLSVAIWGLVVAKAKAGVEAAQKSDSGSVGALVKKAGVICALIAAGSFFQLASNFKSGSVATAPAVAP